MKFGLIKEAIDNKVTELLKEGDNNGANEVLKMIHDDKKIKEQYKLYADVEKFNTTSDYIAGQFIQERVVDFAKLFGKDELTKHNREIAEKLGLDVNNVSNKKMEKLDEFIFGNTKTKSQRFEALINQIKNNHGLKETFGDKFGIEYDQLNEELQKIVKENKDDSSEMFSKIKKSTLKYFNEQIELTSNLDEKSMFIDAKSKIVDMDKYTDENITKLIKLQMN